VKVVFCVPSLQGPTAPFVEALERSLPLIKAVGWEEGAVEERGCPYISYARAAMLRKALDAKADVIVFLDYDLSWEAQDLLTLIETKGDVVAGTYRFKKDEEVYMGVWRTDGAARPVIRDDGCFLASRIPAGFMKITREGVDRFMTAYPELTFGVRYNPSVDLFNHGVIDGVWYGEDYAFSKRWVDCGGEIALIPNLNINHHSGSAEFAGNLHEFMMRQPGGAKADCDAV
jgi:hypothetical protein